jgi:cobalt-zinc-cadmium efflux system outer membrane protein
MQVAGGRRGEPEPDQYDGARRDAKLGTPVSPLPLVTPPGPGRSRSCSRLASQAILIRSRYYFASYRSGSEEMRYAALLSLLSIVGFAIPTSAQIIVPTSAATASSAPRVEIPSQLTLESAIEILLRNNLSLTAARYGVDIARAQRLTASYKPNPTLTLGAEQFDFTGNEVSCAFCNLVTTNSNSAANRTYTFRYDQIFERGDKRRLRTEAADLQLKAAEAQVLDATRQQLFQLKQAFYSAVLARENLRVADENLYLIESTEQLIKLHVESGDTAEGELIKFQTNKVQYQRDLVTSQLAYQQAARDILNILGAEPKNIVSLTTTGGVAPLPRLLADAPIDVIGELKVEPIAVSPEELHHTAVESRPDVIAATRNVEAAQRTVDLAYALRHRDVDVGGEYQRLGSENTFGVVVSIPLFVHNNHQGEIDQAVAQLLQAKTQLNQVRLQAMTDVDKAYKAYEMAQKLLQIYNGETLGKAEEAFRIAGVSYKEGATSLLELREAQRVYNQTRVGANQAHFDYRLSIYQLELATGRSFSK